MADFSNGKTVDGFSLKLWRGERMVLIGMDVEDPEDDLVGFSIEVKNPEAAGFTALRNRLAFSYPQNAGTDVDGSNQYPSTSSRTSPACSRKMETALRNRRRFSGRRGRCLPVRR